LKDIDNAKDEMSKIVEHSKEYTWQQLKNYSDKSEEFRDSFKLELIKTQEKDNILLTSKVDNINMEMNKQRDECLKNDQLLEKALTDLMSDFK